MRVSGLTMLFIAVSMLVSVAIPVGLCIFCRKKWKCDFLPFWVGCGVMFLFAFVLEQGVHAVVLSSAAGNAIKGNLWLYALYGGLMAGLFEETGRLTAMKFLLKKNRGNSHNALMYGAGHGGFEAFFILFFAMLNNLIYSVMINSGNAGLLLQELDAATVNELIEKIVIHSPEKIGGKKHVTIEVYFTYVGKIRIPLAKPELLTEKPA